MAKIFPNNVDTDDSVSIVFEVKLPAGTSEEHLADFGDALEEFVGRFGYELHSVPSPPTTVRSASTKPKISTAP